jgi:hypothetical protein
LHDLERDPLTWPKIVSDFEREFGTLHGDWMRSVELRDRIGEIVAGSEFRDLAPDLQERLDGLHVELVALTRENVCTNERCHHESHLHHLKRQPHRLELRRILALQLRPDLLEPPDRFLRTDISH